MKLVVIGLVVMMILLMVFIFVTIKEINKDLKLVKESIYQIFLKIVAMDHLVDQNNINIHKRIDKILEQNALEE